MLFQKCLCQIAATHFFKTRFEVSIYCLPFVQCVTCNTMSTVAKSQKRSKSVDQSIFILWPEEPKHWARNRKKRDEIVESERAVGGLARQAASFFNLIKQKYAKQLYFLFFHFVSTKSTCSRDRAIRYTAQGNALIPEAQNTQTSASGTVKTAISTADFTSHNCKKYSKN